MDNLTTELKTLEGEFKSAIERADTAASERLNDAISSIESKMAAIEIAANRPAGAGSEAETETKAAFVRYMRSGDKTEIKSMSTTAAEGGYTVPKEIDSVIQRLVVNISPMRKIARVVSVSTPDFHIPFSNSALTSSWVGEKTARTETTASAIIDIVPAFGELYASPFVTQTLLEDSQFDIAGFVATEVATEFARAEGAAFVNGDGTGKPKGILAPATALTADATRAFGTVQHVLTAGSLVIDADSLIALTYTLKGAFRANACFVMTKATLGAVRGLKDTYGQYLWQTGLGGQPSTLLGYPIVEMEDMPEIAASALAVAFGDFSRAYTVADRVGMSMLVDPYSAAPYVAYKSRKRVGGTPVDTQAYKLLKIKP